MAKTFTIGSIISGDAGQLLELDAAALKRWSATTAVRSIATQARAERQAIARIAGAYQNYAIDRLIEIERLRVRRQELASWRWLADCILARKQAKAIEHARRHLANIETAEQVLSLIPDA